MARVFGLARVVQLARIALDGGMPGVDSFLETRLRRHRQRAQVRLDGEVVAQLELLPNGVRDE